MVVILSCKGYVEFDEFLYINGVLFFGEMFYFLLLN